MMMITYNELAKRTAQTIEKNFSNRSETIRGSQHHIHYTLHTDNSIFRYINTSGVEVNREEGGLY